MSNNKLAVKALKQGIEDEINVYGTQLVVETIITDFGLKEILRNNKKREADAALDIRVITEKGEPVTLNPGESKVFGSGLRIHINNPNYFLAIYPRSGLGTKGLHLLNVTGIIDSNYTGEIKVGLINNGKEPITINCYDRVVQGIFQLTTHPVLLEVTEFSNNSDRGDGGFGSTGVK